MSEPVIRDSIGNGSVIVAYGESSPRRFPLPPLAAAAITFAAAVVIGIFALFTRLSPPIPKNAAAIAYLSSSKKLPVEAPAVWRSAQRAASPLPAFVGYVPHENGDLEPFAVTFRTFRSAPAARVGAWQVFGAAGVTRPARIGTLAPWRDYVHGAWLRLWPDVLFAQTGETPPAAHLNPIEGPLGATTWSPRLSLSAPKENQNIVASNFVRLDVFPAAWNAIQNALRREAYDFHLGETPSLITWTYGKNGDLAFSLSFATPMKAVTQANLAAGAGVIEKRPYALPDGTVVNELSLPLQKLTEATTTHWTVVHASHSRTINLTPTAFSVGADGTPANTQKDTSLCAGQPLAQFNLTESNAARTNLGAYPLSALKRVALTEQNGNVTICLE